MKLLHRYVLKSVLLATLTGVGVFVFVLMAGNAVKDIADLLASGQLKFSTFIQLMALLVPYSISFALPLGLLIAILVVLGRMSAREEIVAMKAAGMSLWRIGSSIMLLALLGTMLSAFINNYYAPVARSQYRSMLRTVVQEDPLRFIVPGRFVRDFPGYVIYVGGRKEQTLENVWIWELAQTGQALRLLRANEGRFTFEAENDSLILTLSRGFTELRSESNPDDLQSVRPVVSFEDVRLRLPLDHIMQRTGQRPDDLRSRKLSTLSLPQLLSLRQELKEAVEQETDPESVQAAKVDMVRASHQISRNFALAYSTLALAVFAIPLGIHASRSETYANLGIGLLLALTYYFLIVVAGWTDRSPQLYPHILVWLPNILFQSLGVWLIVRSNHH